MVVLGWCPSFYKRRCYGKEAEHFRFPGRANCYGNCLLGFLSIVSLILCPVDGNKFAIFYMDGTTL